MADRGPAARRAGRGLPVAGPRSGGPPGGRPRSTATLDLLGGRPPGLEVRLRQRDPAVARAGLVVGGDRRRRARGPRAGRRTAPSGWTTPPCSPWPTSSRGTPTTSRPACCGGFTLAWHEAGDGVRVRAAPRRPPRPAARRASCPRSARPPSTSAGCCPRRCRTSTPPRTPRGPRCSRSRVTGAPDAAVRGDRGPAAPGLPRGGDAGDRRARRRPARAGAGGRASAVPAPRCWHSRCVSRWTRRSRRPDPAGPPPPCPWTRRARSCCPDRGVVDAGCRPPWSTAPFGSTCGRGVWNSDSRCATMFLHHYPASTGRVPLPTSRTALRPHPPTRASARAPRSWARAPQVPARARTALRPSGALAHPSPPRPPGDHQP